MAPTSHPTIRHHLDPDDATAIARLHRNVYCEEYGFNTDYVDEVERDVRFVSKRGWPEAGGVWLAEIDGRVAVSLALTFEGENAQGVFVGHVRWFALELELRGSGLGRQLLEELLATAEDQGIEQLELDTFSDLEVAAHLFRSYGFEVASETDRFGWRRDGRAVVYQHYVLALPV